MLSSLLTLSLSNNFSIYVLFALLQLWHHKTVFINTKPELIACPDQNFIQSLHGKRLVSVCRFVLCDSMNVAHPTRKNKPNEIAALHSCTLHFTMALFVSLSGRGC